MPEKASFLGRDTELARIDGILETARHGMSGALVISGAAGCGKSAMLDKAAERAHDLQVLRATGTETEMQMGYAALHQLLRPHLGGLGTLPVPQRRAIETVFGYREGARGDPFLVGLASLDLLSHAGARRPILCLVDDVQWVDPETADVLTFVARRLLADPVGLIMTVRTGSMWAPPTDLPTIELGGLDENDALSIVQSARGSAINPAVAREIVAQTAGNPLALLEVPASLDEDQRAGRADLPVPLPVGPRLEQTLARTMALLPNRTRAILVLAAADPSGSAALLSRTAASSGLTWADLAPAETAEVIIVDESVRFRHPLLRSAAYWAAAPMQRRAAHAAIAAAMPVQQDLPLRAWQLAKASDGPNDEVAAQLEAAGDRATQHGATSGAATSYRMAAEFSVASGARVRRALKAARVLTSIGSPASAEQVLDLAIADEPDDRPVAVAAEIARLRGRILVQQGRPSDAAAAVLDAARWLAERDVRTARDILVEAMAQSLISQQLAPRGTTITDLAAAAVNLALPAGQAATLSDVLLDAYSAYFRHGLPAAGPALRHAIDAVSSDPRSGPDMLPWIRAAGTAAGFLADHDTQWALAMRLQRDARASDDVEALYRSLMVLGNIAVVGGRITQAEAMFAELAAIDEARGRPLTYGRLLIAAWRGDAARTATLYDTVVDEATRYEQGNQLPHAAWARSIVLLAGGEYEAAYLALAPYAEEKSAIQYFLPDTIEAAVRAGRHDDARRILRLLENVAEASPQDRLLGYVARCRALLQGTKAEAEDNYLKALLLHRDASRPAHEARSRLNYGEWLRRTRRLRDARAQLRLAYDVFQRVGMTAFAARAGRELRLAGVATSGTTRPRRPELSGHEADVARLAASGLTNTQIAGQLFVSASTVDYHLRKVFRKLSLSSRRDLGAALDVEAQA